jgi:hypothetical protein
MEQKTNLVVKFSADESPRITDRSDALSLLADIEDAAKKEDLPFVISAVEIIRDAIEREII